MIYGYLRVSTDEQDINSQRQGVNAFAEKKGWSIEKYITDEGVSGGKDPSKRNLGSLLNSLKKGDVVIASEISRLGRDLYMVMDILFCLCSCAAQPAAPSSTASAITNAISLFFIAWIPQSRSFKVI